MTIVLLALVSLFALVATSRPILFNSGFGDSVSTPSSFRTIVQAAFHIHPGKDDFKLDLTRLHFQNPKQQTEYLSEFDAGNIAAAPSAEGSPSLPEEAADRRNTVSTNGEHDSSHAHHVAGEQIVAEHVNDERQEALLDRIPTAPLAVLAFSGVAAFLVLLCIALTLYIIKLLRAQMPVTKTACGLFPGLWKRPGSEGNASAAVKKHFSGGSCHLPRTEVEQQCLPDTEEGTAARQDERTKGIATHSDAVSDLKSERDDTDEKYRDALNMMPPSLDNDLPHALHQPHFNDPPSPSLRSYPLCLPADDRVSPMRGLCPTASWSAWSVRAVDSSPFCSSSCEIAGADCIVQPLIHNHRRAYRSAVPEFDIALAMQLRPRFGIDVDSAWMVRFLMAIFGWFAVALTSNTR